MIPKVFGNVETSPTGISAQLVITTGGECQVKIPLAMVDQFIEELQRTAAEMNKGMNGGNQAGSQDP